jgi:hypothetical protein
VSAAQRPSRRFVERFIGEAHDSEKEALNPSSASSVLPIPFLTSVLTARTGLEVLRLEGFDIEGALSQLVSSIATPRTLKQLHLLGGSPHPSSRATHDPAAPPVRGLLSVRSLQELSLRRLSVPTLHTLLVGLHKHATLRRLDLSFNQIDGKLVQELQTWLRRPRLETLLLDAVDLSDGDVPLAPRQSPTSMHRPHLPHRPRRPHRLHPAQTAARPSRCHVPPFEAQATRAVALAAPAGPPGDTTTAARAARKLLLGAASERSGCQV